MKRLLLPLLALVLVAPACSVFGTAPIATVNGHDIEVETVEDEITAIRGNAPFAASLEQIYGFPATESEVEGAFDSAFVANVLSLRVWFALLNQRVEDEGLEDLLADVTAEVGDELPGQFDSQFGDGAFAEFPDDLKTTIIEQFALPEMLNRWAQQEVGDDPEAFFDAHPEAFTEICVSHVLVGLQGGRTPSEADAEARELRDRIESGEDFTAIASNESDDPAAAAEGGELGCGSKASLQFDPTFEAAAFALEEGEVSEPVQTQFGSHLIMVTAITQPELDEVEDSIQTVMAQAATELQNEFLFGTICGGDVDVNPRYGTWSRASCDELVPQQLPRVEPPEGPQRDTEEPEFQL